MPERIALTSAQRLMLASQDLNPNDPLYNTAFLFEIDGPLDVRSFTAAFTRLVADAEALRTVIVGPSDDPVQEVLEVGDVELPIVDLSDRPDPSRSALEWASGRAQRLFDIETSTYESALLILGDDRHAWFLNQHHVVTDAKSTEVLYRHLESLYGAIRTDDPDSVTPLPSVSSYVELEAQSAGTRPTGSDLEVVPVPLYGQSTQPAGTDNARTIVHLSDAVSDRIREVASRPGNRALTDDFALFQLFATATFAFLRRVGDQETMTIAAPAHNRVSRQLRSIPGLLMELFPIDVTADGDDTFATLHRKVQAATMEYLYRAQPGRADPDVNRRLNVVLNYLTSEFGTFDGLPVRTHWVHPNAVDAHHQLRVQVFDFDRTGRYALAFDIATGLLDEASRSGLADHFIAMLTALVDDWDQPIGEVDLLTDSERAAVSAHATGDRPEDAPRDVLSMIIDSFEARPDAEAIREGDSVWRYSDLDLATRAVASNIDAGSVVGVALPRSRAAVIATIGVLRAGATFVPIDPTWPLDRIRYVVADSGCSLVVAEPHLDLPSVTSTLDRLVAQAGDRSEPTVNPSDLAYILYTSGSTGRPKGVMIERSALANYVSWAIGFYGGGLVFPLFTPLTFDLTITSIFVPLASGGSIVTYPATSDSADLAVLDVFGEDAVDIVKLTPSHLALLVDHDLAGSRIRQLILGGEDLPTSAARRIHESSGGRIRLHNEYGPTEATVGCIVHTYDPQHDTGGSVPIGRPIAGMAAHVLDRAGRPVPFGVPGELWLSGAGLARGYAEQPELTEARFRSFDLINGAKLYASGDLARVRRDGTFEYLGRSDDQVKVNGVRAELGEIEAVLASHADVTAATARLWIQDGTQRTDSVIHCTRCGLPSDYPGSSYDADRVCNDCRAFEEYEPQAQVYFKEEDELGKVLVSQRGQRGRYDCIALLSGGKDSTYVLCRLVDMGLRVLSLTLDNGYISDQAKANIARVVGTLGVEHRYLSTPAMNEIFVDSLQRYANVCNGCFKTIYTLSVQVALEEDVPYIVTGLSRGQFFETRLTADLFTGPPVTADDLDATVLHARKAYHRVDDAVSRLLDCSAFEADTVFDRVQFVDFYRYVDVGLDDLYSYLESRVPWKRPTDTGRSTNCLINDVGIYFHRKTRGFHNYALPYSWDVRMGHKTRDAALQELDDDIDVADVARMLTEIGYPEDVTSPESGRTLIAYYTSRRDLTTTELRAHMASTLPRQLIPDRFVPLDEMPLTQNGKVDRSALPSPDSQRPELDTTFLAPQTDTEIALTRAWEDVLDVSRIGIRDGFLELGGDSISAIRVVAQANRAGLPISLSDLFESLTIERLAEVADRKNDEQMEMAEAPTATSRTTSLSDLNDDALARLAQALEQGESG